ncbi:MAG: hypothetical protein KF824_08410 [Fimbriimonadaceae bacterium]|nr:MAG: hypothetical protein KF824_08410 [Fimbriimonadaceae bacterium]
MSGPNFREHHGKVTATLLRKFGPQHLESVLDATQEAFVAALQSWPESGNPQNEIAWLITTAERRLIDQFRKSAREAALEDIHAVTEQSAPDELALYFMVCNPILSPLDQICLILRTLGGLTALDIARALHESEEAVQRRISRAKNKLTPADLTEQSIEENLPIVLLALYLLFNEGYEATRGDEYIRLDLAREAIILTQQLAMMIGESHPEIFALLALMHFNSSRLPARTTEDGLPVLLEEQDQSLWDTNEIAAGFAALECAQTSKTLSRFHLEAGLAASITANESPVEILRWHTLIIEMSPSPMALLSHAIAYGQVNGAQAGLDKLTSLKDHKVIAKTPHFHCAVAHFYMQLGNKAAASSAYKKAIAATISQPTRASLIERLTQL